MENPDISDEERLRFARAYEHFLASSTALEAAALTMESEPDFQEECRRISTEYAHQAEEIRMKWLPDLPQ